MQMFTELIGMVWIWSLIGFGTDGKWLNWNSAEYNFELIGALSGVAVGTFLL